MRPLHKKLLLLSIPVMLMLAIAIAVMSSQRGKAENTSEGITQPVVASIATLHYQPTAMTEEVPGTIVAVQHADISAKVMSRIAAVYVHEGDHVKAGQLLARLEDKDLTAAVQQASAGVSNAEASFQQAKTGYSMQRGQSAVAIQQAQAALALARQARQGKARPASGTNSPGG